MIKWHSLNSTPNFCVLYNIVTGVISVFCGSKSSADLCSKSPLSSNETEAKREHEVKTIGTHRGRFNCDEVLTCYMLKVLPEYKDARYTMINYSYMYSNSRISVKKQLTNL